jgi:hypothetical protein
MPVEGEKLGKYMLRLKNTNGDRRNVSDPSR